MKNVKLWNKDSCLSSFTTCFKYTVDCPVKYRGKIHVSVKRKGVSVCAWGGERWLKDRTVLIVLSFSFSLTIISATLSCLISRHTKQLIIHKKRVYSFIILECINWRSNVISVINCSAASGHFCDLFQLICVRRSSWQSQQDTKLFQTPCRIIFFPPISLKRHTLTSVGD